MNLQELNTRLTRLVLIEDVNVLDLMQLRIDLQKLKEIGSLDTLKNFEILGCLEKTCHDDQDCVKEVLQILDIWFSVLDAVERLLVLDSLSKLILFVHDLECYGDYFKIFLKTLQSVVESSKFNDILTDGSHCERLESLLHFVCQNYCDPDSHGYGVLSLLQSVIMFSCIQLGPQIFFPNARFHSLIAYLESHALTSKIVHLRVCELYCQLASKDQLFFSTLLDSNSTCFLKFLSEDIGAAVITDPLSHLNALTLLTETIENCKSPYILQSLASSRLHSYFLVLTSRLPGLWSEEHSLLLPPYLKFFAFFTFQLMTINKVDVIRSFIVPFIDLVVKALGCHGDVDKAIMITNNDLRRAAMLVLSLLVGAQGKMELKLRAVELFENNLGQNRWEVGVLGQLSQFIHSGASSALRGEALITLTDIVRLQESDICIDHMQYAQRWFCTTLSPPSVHNLHSSSSSGYPNNLPDAITPFAQNNTHDIMSLLHRFVIEPIQEVQLATLHLLTAIASQTWSLEMLKQHVALSQFIVSRNASLTSICGVTLQQAKFDLVCKMLSHSDIVVQCLGHSYVVMLKEYEKAGPLFQVSVKVSNDPQVMLDEGF